MWRKVNNDPPESGMIVKKWKNGSVWAGMYNKTAKESNFEEWLPLPEYFKGELNESEN